MQIECNQNMANVHKQSTYMQQWDSRNKLEIFLIHTRHFLFLLLSIHKKTLNIFSVVIHFICFGLN